MSIADDLRAAAAVIDEHVKIYATKSRSSADRLRAHADTIERVEKQMRDFGEFAEWLTLSPAVKRWADALKGDAT